MRYYIIINGVNSLTIPGLAIKTLPPISKPAMRNLREEIDGRDGDITTELGYGAYDRILEIGLYGDYDIDKIVSFFNSKGTIIFSDEPDKYYNFEIVDRIDYTKLVKFRTAMINIHCQPFKYPITEEPQVEEFEYVEGTGEAITLDNTEEAILNKIELNGNTYQTQYTGKNILGLVDGTYTSNGVTAVVSDGKVTINGTATANAFINITWITPITWDTTKNYTISCFNPVANNNLRLRVNSGGGMDTIMSSTNATKTITPNNTDMVTNGITIRVENGATISNFVFTPMIELGSQATSYEPYVGGIPSPNPDYPEPIHVVTGYNEIIIAGQNLFSSELENGAIGNNTGVPSAEPNAVRTKDYIKVKPNTQYIISNDKNYACYTYEYDKEYNFIKAYTGTAYYSQCLFTTTENTQYIKVRSIASRTENDTTTKYNLNIGSTIKQYEPYTGQSFAINLGEIELCKIGNYQDYIKHEGDKWYIHKEIAKRVFDGSEGTNAWVINNGNTPNFFYRYRYIDDISDEESMNNLCNRFKRDNIASTTTMVGFMVLTNGEFRCRTKTQLSKDDFIEWITNNQLEVYYIAANITDTVITNETLIEQLEALSLATSKNPQTNILQVNGDIPFILDVSALKLGSDHLVINNSGNIYAKPTIDIEGTGVVDIYLNDVQILEADLSETNNIVIDTESMEAYNPDTNALANRQVTGDYSKIKLEPGENDLRFSGDLSKATVTNYKRWL